MRNQPINHSFGTRYEIVETFLVTKAINAKRQLRLTKINFKVHLSLRPVPTFQYNQNEEALLVSYFS